MEAHYIKKGNGLFPASPGDLEKHAKLKEGKVVRVKIVTPRNYQFHKKFFSLIEYAYENWEPVEAVIYDLQSHIVPINKSADVFRKETIVLAGHYKAFYKIDGTVIFEAESMSFANMTEEAFQELYKDVFNIIWDKIFPSFTEPELEKGAAEHLLQYA